MRTGRVKLVAFSKLFSTTGTFDPYTDPDAGALLALGASPFLWSLQVTGLAADGVTQASLTSWDVRLLGSLDGLAFPVTSMLVQHVNTANANGDTTFSNSASIGQFRGAKFIRLNVNALSLNAATQIKVSVEGY